MEVYIVIRGFPNPEYLSFLKTTKDKVLSSLPMMGLVTESQVQQIGGMLLTMAKDDKIVLYRRWDDQGMEFMRVGQKSRLENPFHPASEILAEIDRDTRFVVEDYYHRDRVTYFQSHNHDQFVPAAVYDEVHQSRYAIMWDDKIGPMPMNTQLYAKKSDVAKLSGNVLEQAGFKLKDFDESTGTVLYSSKPEDATPAH